MKKLDITSLDIRIAVSATICLLTATILNACNIKFAYGEMSLEIIQKMTAAISCVLCCQEDCKVSWRAGVNRMIITLVGGLLAIGVVLLDGMIQNPYIFALLGFVGILLTLMLCKKTKVPYVTARIGVVTFILVACTLAGNARILYAIFRLISTAYGVLVTMIVTWIFGKFAKKNV